MNIDRLPKVLCAEPRVSEQLAAVDRARKLAATAQAALAHATCPGGHDAQPLDEGHCRHQLAVAKAHDAVHGTSTADEVQAAQDAQRAHLAECAAAAAQHEEALAAFEAAQTEARAAEAAMGNTTDNAREAIGLAAHDLLKRLLPIYIAAAGKLADQARELVAVHNAANWRNPRTSVQYLEAPIPADDVATRQAVGAAFSGDRLRFEIRP